MIQDATCSAPVSEARHDSPDFVLVRKAWRPTCGKVVPMHSLLIPSCTRRVFVVFSETLRTKRKLDGASSKQETALANTRDSGQGVFVAGPSTPSTGISCRDYNVHGAKRLLLALYANF